METLNFKRPGEWQKFCTQQLNDALKLSEHQRAQAWAEARRKLIKAAQELFADTQHQRVVIADADLSNQYLEDFDFRYCYLVRVNFRKANVKNAKFFHAILREGSLTDANVKGASFAYTDLQKTQVENLQYNSSTDLNFSIFKPSGPVSAELRDSINQAGLAVANRNATLPHKILNWLTGYGYAIGRVLLLALVIILIFAIVYCVIDPVGFAVGAGSTKPHSLTFWNFVLFSAERFFNASPWIYGISDLTHFLTTLETLFGLVTLGFAIAMLVRKILRST